ARVSGRYESDRALVDFFIESEDGDQQGTVYRATGEGLQFTFNQTLINGGVPFEVPSSLRDVNVDNSLGSLDDSDIFHVGMQIDYDFDWATFTSLTGFKDHEYQYIEDYDASPLVIWNYGQDQEGDYFEQEFRLTSNSDGPLSWYAGASYYEEDIDTTFVGWQSEDAYCAGYWHGAYNANLTCQDVFDYYNYLDAYNGDTYYCDYYLSYYFQSCTFTPSTNGLINDRNRIIGKYSGYSAYVDLSYEVSETFDFSVGLRYSYDEKEFSQEVLPDSGGSQLAYKAQTGFSTPNGPLVDKQDWDELTWRVVGNWRPNDSTLLFGSITTGYKPGGFGSFNIESRVGADCELPFGLCVG
ncbi:MAG: TonB-dependent receptor, partial [Gammaproteobacteria bacterium]|nr:TonB-dependent receptor [Gammaproteobacteria bacterium]